MQRSYWGLNRKPYRKEGWSDFKTLLRQVRKVYFDVVKGDSTAYGNLFRISFVLFGDQERIENAIGAMKRDLERKGRGPKSRKYTIDEEVLSTMKSVLYGWGQFPINKYYEAPRMMSQEDKMCKWELQQLGDYPLVVIGDSRVTRVGKVPCPSTSVQCFKSMRVQHLTSMLKRYVHEGDRYPGRVVFSLGINNRVDTVQNICEYVAELAFTVSNVFPSNCQVKSPDTQLVN